MAVFPSATEATADQGPLDFSKVYEKFQPKVRRYLTHLVGATEAEDLTQEVFARVSHGLPRFRAQSKISTWVYRIATNTAYDRLRSRAFRQERDVSPLHPGMPVKDGHSRIDETLVREQMNDCIRVFQRATARSSP
jgi:RNA polymerase sigma-70 factor (ECF subfamily)